METEKVKYCCDMMRENLNWQCDMHSDPFECPDCIIVYVDKAHEYGISVHDGGMSYVKITYCPWCGSALGWRV